MKKNLLLSLRLILALAVIILSALAFFGHFYPLKFLDIQFTAVLQNALVTSTTAAIILTAALVVITLLFGRIYCSTLCPLGLFQELLTILFKPFYKKRTNQPMKHYPAAWFLAAVLFGTLLGGSVILLRRFDPYSIAGNAMSGAWYGIACITALTVLVFFKKRFFCTNICPVGAVLGILSRFSLFKIHITDNKCKMCSLCTRICPTGSIDFKTRTVNNETCIKCFKCLGHCRQNALYYGLKPSPTLPFSPKRRQLLTGGILLLTFGAAVKGGIELSRLAAAKIKKAVLPAGAGKEEDFANRCLNCNLCVQNCPMKIIKPADAQTPFVHLDYQEAFCDFDCRKCSEVCPSGAIKRLTLAEKQKTKIATAAVDENICVKCGLCVRECPRKVIAKEDGEYPLINTAECIGCGACAAVCPVKAISLSPVDVQQLLD